MPKRGRPRARQTYGNFWRDETSPKQSKRSKQKKATAKGESHRSYQLRAGQDLGGPDGWTAICKTCGWRANRPTETAAIDAFRSHESRENGGPGAPEGQAKAIDRPRNRAKEKRAKREKKRSDELSKKTSIAREIAYNQSVIPPEQIFWMWKEKWFKADPRLERHFKDHPEEKERFLKKSEIVELTKFARPILLEAIEKDRHLEKILEEAKFLQANPKLRQRPRMEPVQGSNEFGYTSVERGHSPRIRR